MTVTATFAVELKDETSGAANAAASSLVKLKGKIEDDVKALAEMQRAMRNLKGGTSTSSAAFANLRDRITASKASIASAQSRFVELGGTFGKVEGGIAGFAGKLGELGGTLSQSGGAVGALGGGLSSLAPLLANPIVIVGALVAAFLALAAVVATVIVSLLRLAIVESDARRSEALHIEGVNMLRQSYGMATASVSDYMAAIDRASDSTNVGRSTLEGYARSLARAGLRGDALTDSVEAMGMAAMVEGDRGAARFRALAVQTRLAGGSVDALAESYRNRLGPIAHRMMLSLPNQTERLHRSIARIFSGINTDRFLGALDMVLSLFSQSTASGRALSTIVEAMFQPMIDDVSELGPIARRFFQGMVIGALAMSIAILRVRNGLRDAFGGSDLLSGFDGLNLALAAGVAFFFSLAIAVVGAAIVFGFLALAILAVVAALLILPALLIGIGAAIGYGLAAAVAWFRDTDFAALGRGMIDGLVAGLVSGRDSLVASMRGLATSAADTFAEALGIHSPSRVFAEFGHSITGGLTEGIDAGSPSVDDSVGGLVESPTGGAAVGGAGATITIGDVTVNAGTTTSPRELAVAFRDELASLLEGVSIEMGAS